MGLRKKHARIFSIEINDEKIDDEIGKLVFEVERHVKELSSVIKQGDLRAKVAGQHELLKLFRGLKTRVARLREDLDRIVDLELERKQYIIIKDENFVRDKKTQLDTMTRNLDDLLEIMQEDPNGEEYQRDVMSELLKRLDSFIRALARIRRDDQVLAEIYASLDRL